MQNHCKQCNSTEGIMKRHLPYCEACLQEAYELLKESLQSPKSLKSPLFAQGDQKADKQSIPSRQLSASYSQKANTASVRR